MKKTNRQLRAEAAERLKRRCPSCGGWVDYDGVGPKAVLDGGAR